MAIFKKAYKTSSGLKEMIQNCNQDDIITFVDYNTTGIDNGSLQKNHSRYSLGNDLQLIKVTNDLLCIEEAMQSNLR